MTLPEPNTPFPPLHYLDVTADAGVAQAWWEGNPSQIAGLYADGPQARMSQLQGGLVGAFGRLFWGKPPRPGQAQPRRLHIPIAADIAATAATQLISDPANFALAMRQGERLGNDQAQQRLDLILNTPEQHSRMWAAAEACSALGGTFARVVWNEAVAQHAWLDYVDADQAIPEFTYGKLTAVTFWRVLEDDGERILRHFERYEPGVIQHGLYLGTVGNVGHLMPLEAHRETAGIPADAEGYIPTGTKLLGASYVPNAIPNPKWRTKGQLRNLGRSDITDPAVVSLMDAIDETYSGLARDVRLAKGRLVVSEHLLDIHRPGRGATFDLEQEVFQGLAQPPGGAPILEAHQFAIRVDEHLRTADAYLRQILMRVGFDPSSFGLPDEGAAMTATEVDSKDRRSAATHKARAGLWKAGHATLAQALIETDAAVFRTGAKIGEPVEVVWPAAAQVSEHRKAETVEILERAAAISLETKVAYLWPDRDEDWRREEVKRIREDRSVAGDPFMVGADQPPAGFPTVEDDFTPDDADLSEVADDAPTPDDTAPDADKDE